MTPTDRDALELCIAIARRDPALSKLIDDRLERRVDWWDIATAASFHCQMESLNLMPWQSPPAHIDADDPTRRRYDAPGVELLRRMLELGISRWHPDPVNEVARVEAERAEQARTKRVAMPAR